MKKDCYCLHLVAVLYVSRHLSHSAKVKLHVDEMESVAYTRVRRRGAVTFRPPRLVEMHRRSWGSILGLISGYS